MVRDRKPLLSSMDVGDWARHYASRPYGHHKAEVYELFVDILSCLPDGADVLDVGAGPGHLAHEFYGRNPETGVGFVLLDASVEMLKIAAERLAGRRVETVHRSFNMAGWSDGVGPFDAIVSNNSLFHVHPENLEAFYRTCYGLLKRTACC
jgi:cyclopropane fatty-acyl-phospholipid synthase-like methyltransferase